MRGLCNVCLYLILISLPFFLCIRYAENGSVSDIVEQFGKFPENVSALYVYQLLLGLKYLHEKELLHRVRGICVLFFFFCSLSPTVFFFPLPSGT